MHLIAYISELSHDIRSHDLLISEVVATAKKENPRNDITGVLFYLNGKFLQVIEGPEDSLRRLMRNIEADPRHHSVDYVIDTPVKSRGFSKWNMDSFDLENPKLFDLAVLKEITVSFKKNLLPRSDMLVFYYRTLLARI